VEAHHHVLQDLGVDGGTIVSKLANVRQLGFLLVVVHRYAVHVPRISAFLERGIVQFPAHAQGRFQPRRLGWGRKQVVFERLARGCLWHVSLLLLAGLLLSYSVWPVQNRKRSAPFVPIAKARGLLARFC